MQRLEVSGAVRPIYGSLGVKRLISVNLTRRICSAHLEQNTYLGYITLQMLRGYFVRGM